ncbi:MAG: hypothetical protein KF715_09530 [Candidatus Didemnitutus sp.]|nr:hypothetical protein [Candidatus Didemnitutus sp.]
MKPTAHASENHAARLLVSVLAGAALGLFAGCGSETVAPVPPPVTPPSTAVVGAMPASQIIITQAPPVAMQEQVIGPRPSVNHLWVDGWWVWRDGHYVWRQGEWVIPPRSGAVWVPPRWERRDDGYFFIEGYWR